MFVLMSCLDHLERHQPLGLDRIHQIVNHVCKSSCRLVIRQPRSPLCHLFCHACTLLNGVGVQCILGSSGAGSKADPIVQPCLASMAWRNFFCILVCLSNKPSAVPEVSGSSIFNISILQVTAVSRPIFKSTREPPLHVNA